MIDHDLEASASRAGVQTTYVNVEGDTVRSSPDAVRAVLAALADDADERDDHADTSTDFDVVVAWDGWVPRLAPGVRVIDDSGAPLDITQPLPLGYHLVSRGDEPVGTLISAPMRAPAAAPGQWGAFLPLAALRRAGTVGIARYPDLTALFDWLHRRDGTILLTLPLLPMYLDEPADWSPYSPVSRRMWSELYVDLDAAGVPAASGPPPDPVDRLLDYPALHRHQVDRLDRAVEALWHRADLHRFVAEHPLVATYARFRAAQDRHGRNFRTWDHQRTPLDDIDVQAERRYLVGAWLAETQLDEVSRHARQQGQHLALDLALGTHADGFDVWHEEHLFVEGMAVGAPPDPIFAGGQDWGFPPVHPARSRATGHRYLRETLQHHLRHADVLRLDHVMGLARQWWVPAGHSATDGAYVSFPLDEMFAVVCLEAHRAGAVIVGENLGTVPPEVNDGLRRHRMLGIHVGQEALPSFGTGHVHTSGRHTMAALSTHDTVPFGGWWRGGDITRSHDAGLVTDAERDRQLAARAEARIRVVEQLRSDHRLDGTDDLQQVAAALYEDLAAQPADVVVVSLEDLWVETEPVNTPGTFQERPNWRRTASRTLEQIDADPVIERAVARVVAARRTTMRDAEHQS